MISFLRVFIPMLADKMMRIVMMAVEQRPPVVVV